MKPRVPDLSSAVVLHVQLGPEGLVEPARTLREVLEQVPDAWGQESGRLIAIAEVSEQERSMSGLRRLMSRARPRLPAWARCSALLARGYVRIGAGCDDAGVDWAWGYVP